jgi:hypothetical protein
MNRRHFLTTACAPVLTGLPLFSQQAMNQETRAKELLAQSVAALGGDKFLNMRTRLETGRIYGFYRAQLTGLSKAELLTQYSGSYSPKGRMLPFKERLNLLNKKNKPDYWMLFDGEDRHEITFRGARPMPRNQVFRYRESNLGNPMFILRFRLAEPDLELRYLGSDIVDNIPVEKLELYFGADAKTMVLTLFRDTKLPLNALHTWRNPLTKLPIEERIILGNYRDAGGVKWPYNFVRERDGEKDFELFADDVKVNPTLEDALFQIPANMTKLKRENE